jgi:hypothetical protein
MYTCVSILHHIWNIYIYICIPKRPPEGDKEVVGRGGTTAGVTWLIFDALLDSLRDSRNV